MLKLDNDDTLAWDVSNVASVCDLFTQPKTMVGKLEDWDLTNLDPELTQFAEITWSFILPVVMQGLLNFCGITEQNIKAEIIDCLKHIDNIEINHRVNAMWLNAEINAYHLESGIEHAVIKKAIIDFAETI